MTGKTMPSAEDIAKNRLLIKTPPGEHWSGRTRYAAAMFLHQAGLMEDDALEVYRTLCRLDDEDPEYLLQGLLKGGVRGGISE